MYLCWVTVLMPRIHRHHLLAITTPFLVMNMEHSIWHLFAISMKLLYRPSKYFLGSVELSLFPSNTPIDMWAAPCWPLYYCIRQPLLLLHAEMAAYDGEKRRPVTKWYVGLLSTDLNHTYLDLVSSVRTSGDGSGAAKITSIDRTLRWPKPPRLGWNHSIFRYSLNITVVRIGFH